MYQDIYSMECLCKQLVKEYVCRELPGCQAQLLILGLIYFFQLIINVTGVPEAFNLSAKQFEKGLISAIEYQTASQTYLNAMAGRTNSLLQLRIKDAVVQYYQVLVL